MMAADLANAVRCGRDGCEAAATHVPQINIPGEGYAATPENSLQFVFGLELCLPHLQALDPQDFVGDAVAGLDGNLRGLALALARGRADPDFDRAFIRPLGLADPAYLALKSGRQSGRKDRLT
jgi:hypothetical protein